MITIKELGQPKIDLREYLTAEGISPFRVWLKRLDSSGPGYRLYFARDGRTMVLLLCGGDKSTQSRDIRRAKVFCKNYLERKSAPA